MPTSSLEPRTTLIELEATFLPVAQMRQLSRVTVLDGSRIEGVVDLGPDHWVYSQHFPRDPIFPGTLMIEAAGQLVAVWAWANGRRGYPRLLRTSASFHHPVTPDVTQLDLHANVRAKRHLQVGTVEVVARGVKVAQVEAVLAVLRPAVMGADGRA